MYDRHNLHVQPFGFHFLIFVLNCNKVVDSLISIGTSSHVLGPICLMVSVPYFTVLGSFVFQKLLFLTSWWLIFSLNNCCIGKGERWFFFCTSRLLIFVGFYDVWLLNHLCLIAPGMINFYFCILVSRLSRAVCLFCDLDFGYETSTQEGSN